MTEQLKTTQELQKLRNEAQEAEVAMVTREVDAVRAEANAHVVTLEAKLRDTQLGFMVGGFKELLVQKVLEGSWAEQRGLREGDELTSLDGKDVKESHRV